jgi:hypothetical protein
VSRRKTGTASRKYEGGETIDKKISNRNHHYRRKGTANVFCGVEPLRGRYYNYVTENKKSPEFAKVMKLKIQWGFSVDKAREIFKYG